MKDLLGIKVLITAGPTREPIDAVRYLSNYSSGKMGYALASVAAQRGAEVVLISGPVALDPPQGIKLISVVTARDMLKAVEENFSEVDIALCSAAVADYRPLQTSDRKLKKESDREALTTITLVENPDILATIGAQKVGGQLVIGFAAETEDLIENAQKKLRAKHADLIVANEVGQGKAFGTDDDEVVLVSQNDISRLPKLPKMKVAEAIFDKAMQLRSSLN